MIVYGLLLIGSAPVLLGGNGVGVAESLVDVDCRREVVSPVVGVTLFVPERDECDCNGGSEGSAL